MDCEAVLISRNRPERHGMTPKEAKALVEKHGSITAAAAAAGIPRSTLAGRIKGIPEAAKAAEGKPAPAKRGKTLAEFRAVWDKSTIIPERVRAGLRQLGANGWEYEVAFAKLAGVSLADLGNFRDEFAEHVVPLERGTRRAWAGSAAMAERMKEALT
jgi:hypothetical protein